MKTGLWAAVILFLAPHITLAQTTGASDSSTTATVDSGANVFTVFGATSQQEAILRAQVRIMHPEIEPLRVFFVPHWKYLDAARTFHLHVPAGYGSLMFTHLPSRTVFIDNDRYQGKEWLGYWLAHELGHLKTNSAREDDAERGARKFRKRLKEAHEKASQGQNRD